MANLFRQADSLWADGWRVQAKCLLKWLDATVIESNGNTYQITENPVTREFTCSCHVFQRYDGCMHIDHLLALVFDCIPDDPALCETWERYMAALAKERDEVRSESNA